MLSKRANAHRAVWQSLQQPTCHNFTRNKQASTCFKHYPRGGASQGQAMLLELRVINRYNHKLNTII